MCVIIAGRHLASCVLSDPGLELCFVWNRSREAFNGSEIPASAIVEDLEKCGERKPDLIVEVAHPSITKKVFNVHTRQGCLS